MPASITLAAIIQQGWTVVSELDGLVLIAAGFGVGLLLFGLIKKVAKGRA